MTPIIPAETHPTKYWHKLNDNRIQCDLCPRACKLNEGQQGLCFVRACKNEAIVLTSYGRSSGFCIDPVEKKPLNHFYPGSPVLSFGTAGCNLACKFCQNWDMSKSREMDTLADQAMPKQLANAALQNHCKSVAYTYNDPIIFHEYAIDVARECRARGIMNIAVTAGYVCDQPRQEFFHWMDAVNVDLKAFTDDFYYKICGARLQNILDTLLYIKHETSVWLEITTLLIPGKNDSSEEIDKLSKWVCKQLGPDVPLHFSAFHPDWKMQDIPSTPATTLSRARRIAMSNGLRFVYTGNVHDTAGGSTWCPQCQHLLISRDWYQLGEWNLNAEGCCSACGYLLPGIFSAAAGQWGRKRQLVRMRPTL